MPFVKVKITRDGVTPEKKAEVIRRVTQVTVDMDLSLDITPA